MTSCLRGVLVQVSCPGSLVPGPPRHPRIRNMRPWASGLGCSATFTEATSKDGRDSGLVWPKAMEEVKRARLALNTVRVIGWLLLYHYRSRLEVQAIQHRHPPRPRAGRPGSFAEPDMQLAKRAPAAVGADAG